MVYDRPSHGSHKAKLLLRGSKRSKCESFSFALSSRNKNLFRSAARHPSARARRGGEQSR